MALLESARRQLGVDVAYVSKFSEGAQHVQCVAGDGERFAVSEGSIFGLEESYCRRMVEGTAPGLVPDT
ncbi:MAG: diguanylate phosphodiesterase, partial [Actinobacteria bacterium]|nr:diguanylate phosphodiesterase [Actinomycetota bacterium]